MLLQIPVRMIHQVSQKFNFALLQAASSSLADLLPGTKFQPVLPDTLPPNGVERVILMSGRLYYDLVKERAARGLEGRVAIIRLEELAPFPFAQLADVLRPYAGVSKGVEWVWVQEEPRNQGAWSHVRDRLDTVLRGLDVQGGMKYVGRREAAVPAPGIGKVYQMQQKVVVDSAFAGL